MVGKRGVQLRVVRSIFRALPFLASMAGSAASSNFNRCNGGEATARLSNHLEY